MGSANTKEANEEPPVSGVQVPMLPRRLERNSNGLPLHPTAGL